MQAVALVEVIIALFDLKFAPHSYGSPRPGYQGTSLQDFHSLLPDELACLTHLMVVRFGADPICPRCNKHGRWQKHKEQRHFYHPCGGIISPTVDSVFHRTRVPLQLWFYAFLLFSNSAQSIATSYLARQLGVSEPTAYRIASRTRAHLAALDQDLVLGTSSEFVFARVITLRKVTNLNSNSANTVRVVALSDETNVHSTVIFKPTRADLIAILTQRVHPSARIITDCTWTERAFSAYGQRTPLVQRNPTYFMDNPDIVDRLHGFFSYFWKSFGDQFRSVNRDKLWLYLKEYEFRYNRRTEAQNTFFDMISSFPNLLPTNIEQLRTANCRINDRKINDE